MNYTSKDRRVQQRGKMTCLNLYTGAIAELKIEPKSAGPQNSVLVSVLLPLVLPLGYSHPSLPPSIIHILEILEV